MSSANQIVEGFLDRIQDVGRIATQILLMKNAHPIVKIIKATQDVKIFVKTTPGTQHVRELNYLDNQDLSIRRQQQQQQRGEHKHREREDKNQYNHRNRLKKIIIIIITTTEIIITEVRPDITHSTAFTTTKAMAEETEMVRRELEEA
jgi:hypothetical protein